VIDSEKVLSKYLRDQTGARLVGKTPENTDKAWVRLTLLDDPAVEGHRSDHLIEAYVQLDCYAGKDGGQPEANELSLSIRAALVDIADHTLEGATASGSAPRRRRSPDPEFTPARERVIVTARVWLHA
jgi:hypothetical protein